MRSYRQENTKCIKCLWSNVYGHNDKATIPRLFSLDYRIQYYVLWLSFPDAWELIELYPSIFYSLFCAYCCCWRHEDMEAYRGDCQIRRSVFGLTRLLTGAFAEDKSGTFGGPGRRNDLREESSCSSW